MSIPIEITKLTEQRGEYQKNEQWKNAMNISIQIIQRFELHETIQWIHRCKCSKRIERRNETGRILTNKKQCMLTSLQTIFIQSLLLFAYFLYSYKMEICDQIDEIEHQTSNIQNSQLRALNEQEKQQIQTYMITNKAIFEKTINMYPCKLELLYQYASCLQHSNDIQDVEMALVYFQQVIDNAEWITVAGKIPFRAMIAQAEIYKYNENYSEASRLYEMVYIIHID